MKSLSKSEYVEGVLAGNTMVLSRAITLLESTKHDHKLLAREILEILLPHTGKSKRICVTGMPGAGKSTFIEAMGMEWVAQNHKVAVLAIDPSSQLTKGSILGDKTRMETLSNQANAYIRPSAAGTTLGGVGRNTKETILLCEAAGYDYIVIETVGVGQSEIAVHSMVDCFVLLLLPGAGDELQGIKRGIMEMADIIAINKSYEGSAVKPSAKQALQEVQNALHYFPLKENAWQTQVLCIDALLGQNFEKLNQTIDSFFNHQQVKGYFDARRKNQDLFWFEESLKQQILDKFLNNESIQNQIALFKKQIQNGEISSFNAADKIIEQT